MTVSPKLIKRGRLNIIRDDWNMKLKVKMRTDPTTKIMIIIFATIASYLISLLLLGSIMYGGLNFTYNMMHMMGHPGQFMIITVLGSLSIAFGTGLILSIIIKTRPEKEDELRIIGRALSEDEKTILNEIRRAGRITQDSLRFRLGWSKAKVSRILTNLDKMNLIQRERSGKTYIVFLSEE